MAEEFSVRGFLQNALLGLYRRSRQSQFIRSPLGRRFFENSYLAYKVLLEAGPIGRLKSYVRPNSWTVDVGANIGLFTLRFARWAGDHGRVISIEPEAENFASLTRRLRASTYSDRVIAIQAVAAEAAGILRLDVNPDHPGDHKLATTGVAIAAVSLDVLLASHGDPDVSLIKIDVQGAEMRVLQGASRLLERCHPALFIEIDDAALRHQGSTAENLFEFLAVRGYRAYRLRRFGAPEMLSSRALARGGYQDVLFLCGHARPTLTAP